MEIKQNLTTINYNSMSNKVNKYIVIHYTGNSTDTAYNNTKYFKSVYREASAHYFVDDNNIYQCVQDKDKAWHCGDSLKSGNGGSFYKKCTNSNSIGVEMCCTNYDISAKTEANTIELVKYLMNKYNIPVSNVIRHYDVTNKMCPKPFVNDSSRWVNFKNKLGGTSTVTSNNSSSNDYTGKITYQSYDNVKKKWLSEVNSRNYDSGKTNSYAGNFGNDLGGLRAKPEYGEIKIQAHVLNGKWLSEVSSNSYIKNDKKYGYTYAGLRDQKLDAIKITSTKGYVTYQVHIKEIKDENGKVIRQSRWLPEVDSRNAKGNGINSYAGNFGEEIDAIRMK